MDPITFYSAAVEGVLPQGARFPWETIGAGGTLVDGGVRIAAVTAAKGYRRRGTVTLQGHRLETQARFSGLVSAPAWASGASGHVLSLDDGVRALGVAIGDTAAVIDPSDGTILWSLPDGAQPGGWTSQRDYLLIKDGTSWWELFVDGRRAFRLPYAIGADSVGGVAAFGFGWLDASGSGSGVWDLVETSVDEPLAPTWKVERARAGMPALVQQTWNPRSEALLRATVGLAHATQDRMERLRRSFTAAVVATQEASFAGDADPTAAGWVAVGSGAFSISRERVRIGASTDPSYLRWDFDTPSNELDAIYYARATFTPRTIASRDVHARLGPLLTIRDGHRQIGVSMVADQDNPEGTGWILSDADPSAAFVRTGDVVFRVDRRQASTVELYVIGRERVVWFVDGQLVEDVPYDRFTTSVSEFDVRIGRDGNADLLAVVTLENADARLSYGDNTFRGLFLRRVAERLLFAGGLERNDRLDAWLRHQHGVFAARGTDRVISEIRRIAGDDDAELVVDRYPGSWYLGITYPGITPTFIDSSGEIPKVFAEYRANAPNFTPAQLQELFETYELPRSAIEAQFFASLVTDLTSSTVSGGGGIVFTVASLAGFAVGDDVTLREVQSDVLLTLSYDVGPTTAADTMDVGAFHGDVWAEWTTSSAGTRGTEIVGSVALGGKIADRTNVVTAGGTVKAHGATGAVDVWLEIVGKEQGTGLPITERLHVVGTANVVGTKLWAEVHGVVCTPAAQANVIVVDVTSAATLYTITAAARASGAYLFDPPLFAGPSTASVTADAATTDPIQLWGAPEGAVYHGERITLNGTTPVVSSSRWSTVRIVAAGYLATARTATIAAALTQASAPIRLVSDSAGDVQGALVFAVDTDGDPLVVPMLLNGTTPATANPTARRWHVLGVLLASPAVGTITLTLNGARPITVGTIAPGGLGIGVDRRRIETAGELDVQLSAAPPGARFVGIFGADEDGALALEVLSITDTTIEPGATAWSDVRGILTGGIASTTTITVAGLAFRYPTARTAIVGLASSYAWTATGPTDLALDGHLDLQALTDATAGPVDLSGTWSVSEDTSISALNPATLAVQTPTLSRSYSTGTRMRRKEPA